jgi:predicted ferric reductase
VADRSSGANTGPRDERTAWLYRVVDEPSTAGHGGTAARGRSQEGDGVQEGLALQQGWAAEEGWVKRTRFPLRLSQPARESLVAVLIVLGALGVGYMWWHDTTPADLQGLGPWFVTIARVTGLVGTYLVVVEVLLMSRVPWLDRLIGMDRLAVWHRRNGGYAISLLVAHAVLAVWGRAIVGHEGLPRETGLIVLVYPDILAATVGLGLLVGIGVLSARAVRRRVGYHTWYFIHLYTYVAIALSFAHQLIGPDFATHPLNQAIWIAMYAIVAALLLTYRVGKPLLDMARHHFVVVRTVDEGPGLVSVYVSGKSMDRVRAEPGQFFMWRFLTRDGWWQAHPFSLSAAPNGRWLRLTAKSLGDYSSTLSRLRPGTKVLLEGPYGAFTRARRRHRKTLMIGAGVGITPLRSLMESLPARAGGTTFLYRASDASELVLRSELDALAARKGARVHYLVGSRRDHPEYLTAEHIRQLAPDAAQSDVFVCGPKGFTGTVRSSLRSLGVCSRQVHTESFDL